MKYRSTLFDEARNKIGSAVASKNAYGNYFRNHVIPHNPKTSLQTNVRATFTGNSQAWRGLTDFQRSGWASLAKQITLTDQLGNKYHQTGQQLFVGCNGNLATLGNPILEDAPGVPDVPPTLSALSVVAKALVASPFTQTLTVDVSGGTSVDNLLVSATAQFSAGRSFVGRSQYRLVSAHVLPLSTALDILTTYQTIFGSLTAGTKLSISVKAITPNGFASADLRADVIVSDV